MSFTGKHHTKETKRKISLANKGKKVSKETKRKLSKINKGKHLPPFSEEHKRKMSEAAMGKKNHNFGKHYTKEEKKIISLRVSGKNNPFYGKHHSKETRKKLSKHRKGKTISVDYHRKLIINQIKDLAKQGFRCFNVDKGPRPDIIAIKNGKVYAVEVESGIGCPRWNKYANNNEYDDIFWYVNRNWIEETKNIHIIKKKGRIKNE